MRALLKQKVKLLQPGSRTCIKPSERSNATRNTL
jgi:hypothetical protein